MKTKIFLFITIISLGLFSASCEKDSKNDPPVYSNNSNSGGSNNGSGNSGSSSTKQYGTIKCINNTSDPYKVEIKGNTTKIFTLEAKKVVSTTVEVGFYYITVTQKSGYIFYATVHNYSGYVSKGEEIYVSF